MDNGGRTKILFVGEGVTLAHVVRPLELACGMDRNAFDVVFACDQGYEHLLKGREIRHVALPSIGPEKFLARVHRAGALFSVDELREYVKDDIRLIAAEHPDVIVSDFRLSLGISAELCGVPHVALSNAHWSPGASLECPVPEHPLVKIIGVGGVRQVLKIALPFFFGLQKKGFNRLRKEYGLPPVEGRGAHEVFTRGTRTAYLDIPELYESVRLSPNESFIGPVYWNPAGSLPAWWNDLPEARPVVFVSPGSSGDADVTARLVDEIARMNVSVILATAGRMDTSGLPGNVFHADFVPGVAAAERANLVVCNGGSGLVYQSLSKCLPVLGLPRNIDQYYLMNAVETKGAGRIIRSDAFDSTAARRIVEEMLEKPEYGAAARRLATQISRLEPVRELTQVVRELAGVPHGAVHAAPVCGASGFVRNFAGTRPFAPCKAGLEVFLQGGNG